MINLSNEIKKNSLTTKKSPKNSLLLLSNNASIIKDIKTTEEDNIKMRSKGQIPASNIWSNSIYSYNRNEIKLLPSADSTINKLIRFYFSLENKNMKSKVIKPATKRKKRIIRKKRLFFNKILTSRPEIKHNNNKIIVTVYMHNLSKVNINKKLKTSYKNSSFFSFLFKPLLLSKNLKAIFNKRKRIVDTYFVLKKKTLGQKNYNDIVKKNKKTLLTKKYYVNSYFPTNVKFMTEERKNDFVTKLKKKDLYKAFAQLLFSLKIRNPGTNSHYYQSLNFFNMYKNSGKFKLFTSANKYSSLIKFKNKKILTMFRTNSSKKDYTTNAIYKLRKINRLFNSVYRTNNLYNKHLFTNVNMYKLLYKQTDKMWKETLPYALLKVQKLSNKIRQISEFFMGELKWTQSQYKKYHVNIIKNYIRRLYRKKTLYMKYKRNILYNNNKIKSWKLFNLKTLISKIYNKKVEINLVDLKYLYLNSDIFSESVVLKLRRKRKLLKVLRNALNTVDEPLFTKKSSYYRTHLFYNEILKRKNKTFNLKTLTNIKSYNDALQNILQKLFTNKEKNYAYIISDLSTNVLNSIKHKYVFGVRLEAAGRLTKRRTASRSLFKVRYKGNLKDMNTIYRGLPSIQSKGNLNSNVQYTKLTNKTRNGAFGIKGWISSN